jgi:hypothetical protein
VKGKVSLTCDAWQASTANAYFAVTCSWVEENVWEGKWQVHTALIGFTQLNNAHNGEHLGQALFKIVARIGIAHKVSTSLLVHMASRDESIGPIDRTHHL